MSSNRWLKIEELYHAALKLEERRRAAFLDQACQGDAGLRREVESLLASDAEAGGFIESPVLELMAQATTDWDISSLVGRQFGTCQILSPIGAGGMGEVYKARDTRLNRNVALKILSRQLIGRADFRQRLKREAHVLASLNHPHIASIYGLEESSGVQALVMELVDGPTLADRMAKGSLPIDEALPIARQIAEALEYAHEKGIIHRDLKPANVKLTAEGVVKLLDFGLAKALEVPLASNSSPSEGPGEGENSPALGAATESGIILGTAAYMAPEQARGNTVDKRADIWSFGVVFYEMLTGKRPFVGETTSDTLASVLRVEPDWNTLRSTIPPTIRKLLRRCLVKERRERLQAIGDARIEITECLSTPEGLSTEEAVRFKPTSTGWKRERLVWMLVTGLLVAATVSAILYRRLPRVPEHAIVAAVAPPEKTRFKFDHLSGPALSPDGTTLAFSAVNPNGKTMLWVRSLDSGSARLLAGTEGAELPFWSPDGRSLGFFSDGKLKIIEVSGGPVLVVCDSPGVFGGSWSQEGTLLFGSYYARGLHQVASSGGTPVPVLKLDLSKHSYCKRPHFLPDGKHFLYWAAGQGLDPASTGIYFASLDGKENRLVARSSGIATYGSGFLVYLRGSTLMAQTFDPERGQLIGDSHLVAEPVWPTFDISQTGVLVYQAGESRGGSRLVWFDRAGKELGMIGETGPYYQVRLSPDGSRLAFDFGFPNCDLWVEEFGRGVRTSLTNDPAIEKGFPVWSPDGNRILFGAIDPKAPLGLYTIPSNGAAAQDLLLSSESGDQTTWPTSWSHDGKFILYSRGDLPFLFHAEIGVLPLDGDRKPRRIVQTVTAAYDGQFSPNGRWIAYTSKESGREQVYVVPFEATKVLNTAAGEATSPGNKWQISPSGGGFPRWRRDGKEIFYVGRDGQMMAAEVEEKSNRLEIRKAMPLFKAAVCSSSVAPYDVTADGRRFVINTETRNDNTPLTLVVNWTARLGK